MDANIGRQTELLGYRNGWSYWKMVEAIGRIVSFSFLELYKARLGCNYWEMDGAL